MTESKAAPRAVALLPVKLFRHISRHRRYQAAALLLLTFLSAVAEVVSLGAVLPFIGILTQPERVFASPSMARIVHAVGITRPDQMVVPLAAAFAAAALIASGLRLLLLWTSLRLTNGIGADLSVEAYRRTLYQPYSVHVSRSSSEIISGITQKVGTATNVLASMASVVTSAALFAAILTTLIVIDPQVASVALVGFGVSYGLIAWASRKRLERNSRAIADGQTHVVKALQEGLGAIRDVLLDNTQAVYGGVYEKAIRQLQFAGSDSTFLNGAPRYVMEALGMALIAFLAVLVSYQPGGIGGSLPVLAALALGAQRLLPLLNQMYGSWAIVTGSAVSTVEVLELLDQPLPDDVMDPPPPALEVKETIKFEDVSFRYGAAGPWVVDGFNLSIRKGSQIGIIGSTGSGKSTALDLLMSLLRPTRGQIVVDGKPVTGELRRAWQRSIAHVPQSIFLADTSIAENIAFGVPREEIDLDRVKEAAHQAQVAEFIESRAGGYSAIVGERGIRLSGGQRQRIGIARALYKRPQVLIFDEATSALDGETERGVMSAIYNLNRELTIVIVAHRLTTLRHCDTIIQIERGQVAAQGTYERFVNAGSTQQARAHTRS